MEKTFNIFTVFKERIRKDSFSVVGFLLILLFFFTALLAPFIATHSPYEQAIHNKLAPPSIDHFFGTDYLGRDLFSRVVYGARISFQVGTIAVIFALILGSLAGLLAGYYGGAMDSFFIVITDILLAFPGVLLAISIIAIFGPGLHHAALAIGIYSFPQYARVMRGSVIAIRESPFIEASQALGSSSLRILCYHILPNAFSPLIVLSTLRMASAVLGIATLSFLGLGAQPPTPEWGTMLSQSRTYFFLTPHVMIFPGLSLLLFILGFNLVGDALRDLMDPRIRD